jgi:uncharacterized protein (TIGR00290 family)
MKRVLLSFSSGKDSAWALHVLRRDPNVVVVGLLTTLNQVARRVAMHAVREELLDAQARALGLPLFKVPIPSPCSNEEYELAMGSAMSRAKADAVDAVAFGDLYLEDIRRYREEKLSPTGIAPLFPLWGLPTAALAREMVASGLRAHVTCVDPKQLDPSFVGRTFDASFLDDLPPGVDPCGENGEFHSFAYEGPMFREPLAIEPGVSALRDGFFFADVTLSPTSPFASF